MTPAPKPIRFTRWQWAVLWLTYAAVVLVRLEEVTR